MNLIDFSKQISYNFLDPVPKDCVLIYGPERPKNTYMFKRVDCEVLFKYWEDKQEERLLRMCGVLFASGHLNIDSFDEECLDEYVKAFQNITNTLVKEQIRNNAEITIRYLDKELNISLIKTFDNDL